MSVYIKGMEMPTTGLYLVSVDNSCGKDETVMIVRRMLGDRDVCQIIGAYNLAPFPEHGDLIDRDALPTSRVEWEDVVNAPTIIPADKEVEE